MGGIFTKNKDLTKYGVERSELYKFTDFDREVLNNILSTTEEGSRERKAQLRVWRRNVRDVWKRDHPNQNTLQPATAPVELHLSFT